MSHKYQQITAARKLLELPETATMTVIESDYRKERYRAQTDRFSQQQSRLSLMQKGYRRSQ